MPNMPPTAFDLARLDIALDADFRRSAPSPPLTRGLSCFSAPQPSAIFDLSIFHLKPFRSFDTNFRNRNERPCLDSRGRSISCHRGKAYAAIVSMPHLAALGGSPRSGSGGSSGDRRPGERP